MLRNNADARRCSYFELGLPVLPQVDLTGDTNTALQDTFITIAGYQNSLRRNKKML